MKHIPTGGWGSPVKLTVEVPQPPDFVITIILCFPSPVEVRQIILEAEIHSAVKEQFLLHIATPKMYYLFTIS